LKTTSVAAASSEAAVKKKVSKNLVKKAKILSQGKMMKSSPNSSTSVVKSAKKSSAKVQKLKIKIGSKKGAGKENSNKQPFQFEKLKLKSLSPALALICGKPQMSRHEAVREIWAYIKKQKLQDPGQKTIIFCDEKLKAVTKKKKVTCSEILTCLSQNMTAIKN
jgi:upstream activation factor subunit UAF30